MSEAMDWHSVPELAGHVHSDLFAQALSYGSNLALDWLWLAAQLDDAIERQYCLKRAHYIDPDSVVVDYSQIGLVVKLTNLAQSILKRRTASTGRSEEQLATNF